MLKLWTAHLIEADTAYAKTRSKASLMALQKASEQCGEWEKRKAGAMSSTKVDLLKKVLAKLEAQDDLANELMEIEE